ncbi:hypothetical protein ACLOJK_010758 [Asimina triloba]
MISVMRKGLPGTLLEPQFRLSVSLPSLYRPVFLGSVRRSNCHCRLQRYVTDLRNSQVSPLRISSPLVRQRFFQFLLQGQGHGDSAAAAAAMECKQEKPPKRKCHVINNKKNWSNLPTEILVKILTKLCLVDYACARSVCSSWRASAMEVEAHRLRPFSCLLPLFLLSDGLTKRWNLLHLFDERVYKLHLPEQFGATYLESFEDWMAMVSADGRLSLLEPVHRKTDVSPSARRRSRLESATRTPASRPAPFFISHFKQLLDCGHVLHPSYASMGKSPPNHGLIIRRPMAVCYMFGSNMIPQRGGGRKMDCFQRGQDHTTRSYWPRAAVQGQNLRPPHSVACFGGYACVLSQGYQLTVWELNDLYPHALGRIDMFHYSGVPSGIPLPAYLVESSRGELLMCLLLVAFSCTKCQEDLKKVISSMSETNFRAGYQPLLMGFTSKKEGH